MVAMPGPPTTPESISSKGGNLNIRRYADSSPAPEPHDANGVSADEPVAFIPMASVAEGGGWVSAETRPLADGRKGYTLFQHGDVIIAKITPCFENGQVALLSDLDTEYGLGSTEFPRPAGEALARSAIHLPLDATSRPSARRRSVDDRLGRATGVILLISTMMQNPNMAITRCNLSGWYVEPRFRAYAAILSTLAACRT